MGISSNTVLKVIAYQHPELFKMVNDQLVVKAPVDEKIIRQIHQYTHIIHNSYDNMYNTIVFLACGIKLYSPETLHADCRIRDGVAQALANEIGLSRSNVCNHVKKYVRFYYEKRKGFAELVDSIVAKFG